MEKVCEELVEAKVEIENLKCNLNDKESIIEQMSSTNDTIQADCHENLEKLEDENRRLLLSLDEANEEETMSEKDDLLQDIEEDRHRKVEDELKWKVEQFKHLEEAHEKLRDEIRTSKSEFETEKSLLRDEISKLQETLDHGNRTTEDLKNQLDNCKEALDHEENRRKRLESQVSDTKSSVENVPNEDWEEESRTECSSMHKVEEEIATLRHSLRVKEIEYKDMEYKANKLEKENQELVTSMKELQEARISKASSTPQSSWGKLRSKLKYLEQAHKDCSTNLREKEAKWTSQSQEMSRQLYRCTSSLNIKDQVIDELKNELTRLKLHNEELSLMLQLTQSKCSEQAAVKQRKLIDELDQVYDALDRVNSELIDKTNEGCELEFTLQTWKSIAERLKRQFEESIAMRKDLEASLLAQVEIEENLKRETEEKDRRISNLEEQILLFDQEIRIGEEDSEEENENVVVVVDNDDRSEQELLARDLEEAIVAHIMAEKNYTHQNGNVQYEEHMEAAAKLGFDNGDQVCSAKENVNQEHCFIAKTGESIIDERSPFRELN